MSSQSKNKTKIKLKTLDEKIVCGSGVSFPSRSLTNSGSRTQSCFYCRKDFLPKSHRKQKYCSIKCASKAQVRKHRKFGHLFHRRDISGNLRKFIYLPGHPCSARGIIIYARWVMEKKMRRFLKPTEIVHHINRNTLDDRIENLRVFVSRSTHQFVHTAPGKALTQDSFMETADMLFEIFDIYNPHPYIKREF